MQNRHIENDLDSNKYSFFNNYIIDVFLFVTAMISLVVTVIVMYIMCRLANLKSLVTSITLQQIRGTDAVSMDNIECTHKTQWYTIAKLGLVILGHMIFVIINIRKLKLFRGHMFSNAVKIMLFILDTQYCVPVKLCRNVRIVHLFKIRGKLTPEQIALKRDYCGIL